MDLNEAERLREAVRAQQPAAILTSLKALQKKRVAVDVMLKLDIGLLLKRLAKHADPAIAETAAVSAFFLSPFVWRPYFASAL